MGGDTFALFRGAVSGFEVDGCFALPVLPEKGPSRYCSALRMERSEGMTSWRMFSSNNGHNTAFGFVGQGVGWGAECETTQALGGWLEGEGLACCPPVVALRKNNVDSPGYTEDLSGQRVMSPNPGLVLVEAGVCYRVWSWALAEEVSTR